MKAAYLILVFVSLIFCMVVESDRVSDQIKELELDERKYRRTRCTRRYTVGSCPHFVRPVWTFVPPLQSCTERLGCPSGTYVNRFDSLQDCLDTCRDLIYLFMYLQSADNTTFVVPDSDADGVHRRSHKRRPADSDNAIPDQDRTHEVYSDSDYLHVNVHESRRQEFQLDEALSELSESNPEYPEPPIRRFNKQHQESDEEDLDHNVPPDF